MGVDGAALLQRKHQCPVLLDVNPRWFKTKHLAKSSLARLTVRLRFPKDILVCAAIVPFFTENLGQVEWVAFVWIGARVLLKHDTQACTTTIFRYRMAFCCVQYANNRFLGGAELGGGVGGRHMKEKKRKFMRCAAAATYSTKKWPLPCKKVKYTH